MEVTPHYKIQDEERIKIAAYVKDLMKEGMYQRHAFERAAEVFNVSKRQAEQSFKRLTKTKARMALINHVEPAPLTPEQVQAKHLKHIEEKHKRRVLALQAENIALEERNAVNEERIDQLLAERDDLLTEIEQLRSVL